MPFERLSKKGLPFPVVDDPVATQELAELVDVSDAYIMEQWATDIVLTGGLTYAYKGGTVFTGGAYSQVADGTVTLAASDVNYVERDADGVVTVNQTAFTDTKLPMAKVTTDVTGITDIEDWRVMETPSAATVASHVVATTVALGPSHSVSALSSGMVLRATGATTSTYGYLIASDIPALDASKITTGTLDVARGGTGVSSPTSGNLLVGAGASAMTLLAPGAAGGYVRSTGAAWARSALLASDLTGTTLPASIVTSSLTTIGTLIAGAVAASLITAGTFGTGAYVFDNTVSGITTLTATTLAGTLSTAAQPNVTSLGTLTSLAVSGTITMTAGVSKIVPGATSWGVRNTADSADNIIITNAGAVTFRSTIGGITTLTATSLVGALTGNASTATALETARTINGVSFDGTANITVTAAAGTLTGTTLNAAVVTSSLTSVGTIATGVWSGTAIVWTKVDKSGSVLADIGNVTITAIATGEILKWSGTAWINNTLAEAGVSAAAHTHVKTDITDTPWAWTDVSKTGSSLADLVTRSAADLTSGTLASARITGVYSGISGLGAQAQALDMGTNNITNAGTGTFSGNVLIGTTIAATAAPRLDVLAASQNTIVMTSSAADATTKTVNLGVRHYTNAEEVVSLVRGRVTSSTAQVQVGGGASTHNAATVVEIYTAANNTTLTGTKRFAIDSTGAADFQGNAVSMGAGTFSDSVVITKSGGSPMRVNNTGTAANFRGHFEGYRGSVRRWVLATNSSDEFVLLNAAFDAANLTVTDAGALTVRSNLTVSGAGASSFAGNVLIGTTTAATGSPRLDVLGNGNRQQPHFVGVDSGGLSDATDKAFNIGCRHNTIAEEEVMAISVYSGSTNSWVRIGGGRTGLNAVTIIEFYTAANNTTVTGTLGLDLTGVGTSSILRARGGITVDKILSVDDTTDTTSTVTGSIHTDGGLGIAKALWVGTTSQLVGAVSLDSTLQVDGSTKIGTTANATGSPRLNVVASGAAISLTLSDSATNAVNKNAIMGFQHYTIAEENISLLYGVAQSGTNTLKVGGGAGSLNAVTTISFWTGAGATTLTGTLAADITGVGATSLLHLRGKLKVVGTTTFNTVAYTWPGSDGGSGDILTTNGVGGLSWTAGGGGTLGGTGTAGTIAKWTAASTLADSIITESGTTITVATTLNATTLGGTLSTAAQANITSLGSLTSLDMAGQIDLNNNNIIAGGTAAFTTVTAALTGNASTATVLQTARTINGVSFNGSANITVTADANTLTNTTLKSTVVASSLTSVGTLTSLDMGGNIDLNTNDIVAGGAARFTTVFPSGGIVRGANNLVLTLSGGSTVVLGANIALFAESHVSKAKDIEFRDAGNIRMKWVQSASEFTVFGQMKMDDGGLATDVAGVVVSSSDPVSEDYVDGTLWCRV